MGQRKTGGGGDFLKGVAVDKGTDKLDGVFTRDKEKTKRQVNKRAQIWGVNYFSGEEKKNLGGNRCFSLAQKVVKRQKCDSNQTKRGRQK